MILWGQCCYPHFAEGKTEAQLALVRFEPSQSGCGARVLNCCPDNCGQALCHCKAPHVLKMRTALSQYLGLSAQPVGSGLAAPCQDARVWVAGGGGWGALLSPLRRKDENWVLSAEAWIALFGRAGTITNDI